MSAPIVSKTKHCTKCGETKPVEAFSKHKCKKDGLQSKCKACAAVQGATYFAGNRVAKLAKQAAHYAANREDMLAKQAAYRAENRQKCNAAVAKWARANPDARRIHKQNRRAQEAQSGGKLSRGITAKLFKLQQGKCACCGETLETLKNGSVDGKKVHLDHIMPISKGGTNTDKNMQLLTSTCNLEKNAKHPVDFMQSRGFLL
jgi:5-methylcytosine-specific restriction endonuclease McrA